MSKTQEPEKKLRLYNRSNHRAFIHEALTLASASFLEVPVSVAENWMKMFPNDIVEAGIAQKEMGGLGAELAETKAKLASVESQLANIKTDPKGDKARAELEKANERIRELEKQLAKLSPKSGSADI